MMAGNALYSVLLATVGIIALTAAAPFDGSYNAMQRSFQHTGEGGVWRPNIRSAWRPPIDMGPGILPSTGYSTGLFRSRASVRNPAPVADGYWTKRAFDQPMLRPQLSRALSFTRRDPVDLRSLGFRLPGQRSAPGSIQHISSNGVNLVKSLEGFRAKAYLDSARIPTIGYGHTKNVRMGDVINEAQAEELLRQDLHVAELAVRRNVKVALTQNQFDALVSWTFNLGEGSLRDSTLLRLLNRGQTDAVPAQMKRWNKARVNGKLVPLPGLTARRNREAELWSKP